MADRELYAGNLVALLPAGVEGRIVRAVEGDLPSPATVEVEFPGGRRTVPADALEKVQECADCGRRIRPGREAWMEWDDGRCLFVDPDPPRGPEGGQESAGLFPLGTACARRHRRGRMRVLDELTDFALVSQAAPAGRPSESG